MTVALKLTSTASRTKWLLPIPGEHSKLKSPSMFGNPLVRMNKQKLVVLRLSHAALLIVSIVFSLAADAAPRGEAARPAASERSGAGERGGRKTSDLMLLRRAAPLVDLVGAG